MRNGLPPSGGRPFAFGTGKARRGYWTAPHLLDSVIYYLTDGVILMPKGVPNKRYTPEFKKLVSKRCSRYGYRRITAEAKSEMGNGCDGVQPVWGKAVFVAHSWLAQQWFGQLYDFGSTCVKRGDNDVGQGICKNSGQHKSNPALGSGLAVPVDASWKRVPVKAWAGRATV